MKPKENFRFYTLEEIDEIKRISSTEGSKTKMVKDFCAKYKRNQSAVYAKLYALRTGKISPEELVSATKEKVVEKTKKTKTAKIGKVIPFDEKTPRRAKAPVEVSFRSNEIRIPIKGWSIENDCLVIFKK